MRLKHKRWVPGASDEYAEMAKRVQTAADNEQPEAERDAAIAMVVHAYYRAVVAEAEFNFAGRWVYVEEGM